MDRAGCHLDSTAALCDLGLLARAFSAWVPLPAPRDARECVQGVVSSYYLALSFQEHLHGEGRFTGF